MAGKASDSVIDNFAYDSGVWFARHIVVPFALGLLDEAVPALNTRIQGEVRDIALNAVPSWARRFIE